MDAVNTPPGPAIPEPTRLATRHRSLRLRQRNSSASNPVTVLDNNNDSGHNHNSNDHSNSTLSSSNVASSRTLAHSHSASPIVAALHSPPSDHYTHTTPRPSSTIVPQTTSSVISPSNVPPTIATTTSPPMPLPPRDARRRINAPAAANSIAHASASKNHHHSRHGRGSSSTTMAVLINSLSNIPPPPWLEDGLDMPYSPVTTASLTAPSSPSKNRSSNALRTKSSHSTMGGGIGLGIGEGPAAMAHSPTTDHHIADIDIAPAPVIGLSKPPAPTPSSRKSSIRSFLGSPSSSNNNNTAATDSGVGLYHGSGNTVAVPSLKSRTSYESWGKKISGGDLRSLYRKASEEERLRSHDRFRPPSHSSPAINSSGNGTGGGGMAHGLRSSSSGFPENIMEENLPPPSPTHSTSLLPTLQAQVIVPEIDKSLPVTVPNNNNNNNNTPNPPLLSSSATSSTTQLSPVDGSIDLSTLVSPDGKFDSGTDRGEEVEFTASAIPERRASLWRTSMKARRSSRQTATATTPTKATEENIIEGSDNTKGTTSPSLTAPPIPIRSVSSSFPSKETLRKQRKPLPSSSETNPRIPQTTTAPSERDDLDRQNDTPPVYRSSRRTPSHTSIPASRQSRPSSFAHLAVGTSTDQADPDLDIAPSPTIASGPNKLHRSGSAHASTSSRYSLDLHHATANFSRASTRLHRHSFGPSSAAASASLSQGSKSTSVDFHANTNSTQSPKPAQKPPTATSSPNPQLSHDQCSHGPKPSVSSDTRPSLSLADRDLEDYLSAPRLSQIIDGPHGRRISFAEVGDPNGFPVFCCVGMGLTRYIMTFYDELAAVLKLRLITPERPGVGDSDSDPEGNTMPLNWPDDVLLICETLRIRKFSILAHSAGAIYALATALRMPDYIVGPIHLLAPWVPPSQLHDLSASQPNQPVKAIPPSQRFLRMLPTSILKVANSSLFTVTSDYINASFPKRRGTANTKTEGRSGRRDLSATFMPWANSSSSATPSASRPGPPTVPALTSTVSQFDASLTGNDNTDQRPSTQASQRPFGFGSSSVIPSATTDTDNNHDTSTLCDGSPLGTLRDQQQHRSTLSQDIDIASTTADADVAAAESEDYDSRLADVIWELSRTNANPVVDLLVCLEQRHTIGFRYVDITLPVIIRHGQRDRRVPLENVAWLGEKMKSCEVRVLETEGHSLMASATVMGAVLMEISEAESERRRRKRVVRETNHHSRMR